MSSPSQRTFRSPSSMGVVHAAGAATPASINVRLARPPDPAHVVAASDTVQRTFPVSGDVLLRISVPAGVVEIDASADGEVAVELKPSRGGGLDEVRVDAVSRAAGTEIVVHVDGERWGFVPGRRAPAVHARITCPPGAAVDVRCAKADVRATGVLGAVAVRSASGDLRLERAAALDVSSTSGDVAADMVDGALDVQTISGDIDVRDVGRDVSVSVVSGDVRVASLGGRTSVSTVSGDVDLGCVAGDVNVNGVSSDVRLGVAPGHAVWFDVRSASGDVRSDLEVSDASAAAGAPRLEIVVQTVSGDVHIRRAG